MKLKGITDEDFVNYKKPSMFISACSCTFKCEKESGVCCCQNSGLAKSKTIEADDDALIRRYLANPITKAIVFGGLEPFDQPGELKIFLEKLRSAYHCTDDVVIYTGYTKEECAPFIGEFSRFGPLVVKYGRFIPGMEPHTDRELGVKLASDNQFAERIG